jgi:hypothetical protein
VPRRKLSDKEKAAIKKGREEAQAVKKYLESLGSRGPGRRQDPKRLEARLQKIRAELESTSNTLKKLELKELERRIKRDLADAKKNTGDGKEIEKAFIQHAASYARRKGISYSTFRQMGVPPAVLQKAGIKRTRG